MAQANRKAARPLAGATAYLVLRTRKKVLGRPWTVAATAGDAPNDAVPVQLCSMSIDGHPWACTSSLMASKDTVALIAATPGLGRYEYLTKIPRPGIAGTGTGSALASPVGIHGRIEVASVLRCIQGISLQRAQQGTEPCLVYTRLGAGTWEHVEQGIG